MMAKDQNGTVLLFTILILGLAAVSAFFALSRAGIDVFIDGEQQEETLEVRAKLYGCLDEALLQFNVDADYTDATIDTQDAQCSLSVANVGGYDREVNITLTDGSITRGLFVELTAIPIQVTSISEQL